MTQQKRKGDESFQSPVLSKRTKVTDSIIVDSHFSELILPLFESRGWNYNSKSHELCKDRQRFDCVYAATFIRSNPIWIDVLEQIRHQDQTEPNKAAYLDFLVAEIADRVILTKQQKDRIDYQAFVEAHSESTGYWDSATLAHGSNILSSSITTSRVAVEAKETLAKSNTDHPVLVRNQNFEVENASAKYMYSRVEQTHDTLHSSMNVEETKDLDLDDDHMFAIPATLSSPASDSPLAFEGNDFDDLMGNDEREKPSLPMFEETHDSPLEEMQLGKGILDMQLIEVTDTNKGLFVRATKRLPKLIPNDLHVFEPWSIKVNQFIKQVFSEMSEGSTGLSQLINAEVEDCKRDPLTQILSVQGRRDAVEVMNNLVTKEILRYMAEYNSTKLLKDGRSVLCNIGLDITKDLGFTLAGGMKNNVGLWLKNIDQDKQLGRILGLAAERGVVLLSIGGEDMNKPSDKKKLVDQARLRGNKILSFKFCLHRSSDPKTMKIDQLLKNDKGLFFERVDGSTLDFHEPNISASDEESLSKDQDMEADSASKTRYFFYGQFVGKIKAARNLEFIAGSKYCKRINSSMWNRHKELFGEKCETDCPCLHNLRKLIENIGRDCSQPDVRQALQERSGFISFFIGKFSSKVQKEFPSYSSQEILGKLVEMWGKHKSEPRFGLTCTKDCTCGEIWTKMIKSSVNNSEANPMAAPRPLARKSSDESAHIIVLSFPCNKPLGLYVTTVSGDSSDLSKCVVASIAPTFQNKNLRVGAIVTDAAPLKADSIMNRVRIQSHLQLKEYYHAAKINNSKIKIWFDNSLSGADYGEHDLARNWSETSAWLQDETSGWAGGAPLANSSPSKTTQGDDFVTQMSEFRESSQRSLLYEAAHLKKITRMVGSDSKQLMQSEAVKLKSHTQPSTSRGKISIPIRSSSISSNHATQSRSVTGYGSAEQPPPNTKELIGQRPRDSFNHSRGSSSSSKDGSVLLSAVPSLPRSKSTKKVHFAEDLYQYLYIPPRGSEDRLEDELNEQTLPTQTDDTESRSTDDTESCSNVLGATIENDIPIQKRRAQRLLKSIYEGTLRDMIDALNDGIDPNDRIDGDDDALTVSKKRLNDANINEEEKEMVGLKRRVLKIWSNARYAMDIARYVDESKCIQFVPRSTDGVELSATGGEANLSHLVTCTSPTAYTSDGDLQKMSLPILPFQSSIDWSQTVKAPFFCCYNSKIDRYDYKDPSGKQLEVRLEMGNSERKVELGTWKEYIYVIEGRLDEKSKVQWPEICREMVASRYLAKGSMTVMFKRATCPEKYLSRKRQKALDYLNDISIELDKAQRLCKEPIKISSMIVSRVDGVNLLHAAVYLRDVRLVNHFLHQGCDSEMKGKLIGTPLDLASNLAGKALKKCDREMDNQYHEIIRVLKDARFAASRPYVRQSEPDPDECGDQLSLQSSGEDATMSMVDEMNGTDQFSLDNDSSYVTSSDENRSDIDERSITHFEQPDHLQHSNVQTRSLSPSLESLHLSRRSSDDHDDVNKQLPSPDDMPISECDENNGDECSRLATSLHVQESCCEVTDDSVPQHCDNIDEPLPSPASLSEDGKKDEAESSRIKWDMRGDQDSLGKVSSHNDAQHLMTDQDSLRKVDNLNGVEHHDNVTVQVHLPDNRSSAENAIQQEQQNFTNDGTNAINEQGRSPDDVSLSEDEGDCEYTSSRLACQTFEQGEHLSSSGTTLLPPKDQDTVEIAQLCADKHSMENSSSDMESGRSPHPQVKSDQKMPSVGRGRGRTIPAWMSQKESQNGVSQRLIIGHSSNNDHLSSDDSVFKSRNNQASSSNVAILDGSLSSLQGESPGRGRGRGRTLPSWMSGMKTSPQAGLGNINPYWEAAQGNQSIIKTSSSPQSAQSTEDRTDISSLEPRILSIGRGRSRTTPSWMTNRSEGENNSFCTETDPNSNTYAPGRLYSDRSISTTWNGRHHKRNESDGDMHSLFDREKPARPSPQQNRTPDKARSENRYGGCDDSSFSLKAEKRNITDERSESTSNSEYQHPNEQGDRICRFFGTAKGCNKGSQCPFVHVSERASYKYVPNRYEWVDGKQNVCRFFSSSGICKFAPTCNNAHINPNPPKDQLNESPRPLDVLRSNGIYTRVDESGRSTAVYKDWTTGILYFAYGRNCVYEDALGSCWYTTESDAIDALACVVNLCALKQTTSPKQPRMNRSSTI